ncbi:TonB-dependent receptor [Ampullimonas aquatilis]|uniref:TonB-dependent receptor n=1 Tax=Ampullimonas aquatilis TaxID=1341549 RepID=UPI003C75D158
MNQTRLSYMAFAVALLSSVSGIANACSSCGCTLSSDWDSQGYTVKPGMRFDLRYDYLNQNQLRTGTGKVDRGAITYPADREIEEGTRNQYLTLGFDYNPNQDWGINIQIPYIHRPHSTITENETDVSTSKTTGLGDIRVVGRYQGFVDEKNVGIQFGLKLATGSIHDTFKTGPEAGNPLDRGLQTGTGTTDLLLGLYHFGVLNQSWDYFAQGMLQFAINERESYKPGTSLNLNGGFRYLLNDTVVPQIQVNAKTGKRDSGDNADRDNSGGTLVYLSPGVTVSVTKDLKAFGFIQLPVYQNVNGYQLAPRYTFSLGLRYSM